MILTLVNVIYVLVAVAMIVLILLQRGAGAAAGSGFGAGASATVFGARGASNFLSKSTAALAAIFFAFSLGMAMYASRGGISATSSDADLGVMGGAALEAPAAPLPADVPPAPEASATPTPVPSDVPAATSSDVPAAAPSETPAAPVEQEDNGG